MNDDSTEFCLCTKKGCKCENEDSFKLYLNERLKDPKNGEKLKFYLDKTVPTWKTMKSNFLRKKILSMLDSATTMNRFEIELTWKRAAYFVGLLIFSVTGFGYLYLNLGNFEDVAILDPIYFLIIISILNILFSIAWFFSERESKGWQYHWEIHASYLQLLLGIQESLFCLKSKSTGHGLGFWRLFMSEIVLSFWLIVASYLITYTIQSLSLCPKIPFIITFIISFFILSLIISAICWIRARFGAEVSDRQLAYMKKLKTITFS